MSLRECVGLDGVRAFASVRFCFFVVAVVRSSTGTVVTEAPRRDSGRTKSVRAYSHELPAFSYINLLPLHSLFHHTSSTFFVLCILASPVDPKTHTRSLPAGATER